MASLLEMAAEIVTAHASKTGMTKEELIKELDEVHQSLKKMESGETVAEADTEAQAPVISKRKAFGRKSVTCMLCGKKMTTLTRHLQTTHNLKPGEYRKQFGIPRSQSLASGDYVEKRRQMAIDRGLGENLAKARAAKAKKK